MSPAPQPAVVVGVGASAGGVEALSRLVRALPRDFGGALLVVLHVAPEGTSVLPQILGRAGVLPSASAVDGEPLRPAHVYVAPPDCHLLVRPDSTLWLDQGPRENGHRPAIDPTFRSLADVFGARAAGVVLSGTRDDGAAGLQRIKSRGGRAFVQDPEEAMYPAMPRAALHEVDVDAVAEVQDIARRLTALADTPEPLMTPVDDPPESQPAPGGDSTQYTCPDCGGVLWLRREGSIDRYVCSVGHA